VRMNWRRNEILAAILGMDDSLTLQKLANRYGISLRMARYDVKSISDFLVCHSLPSLILDKNGTLLFNKQSSHQPNIQALLSELEDYSLSYNLPASQRIYIILARLLTFPGYVTINELAEMLGVSRNTVINDLPDVRVWLLANHLYLQSAPKNGLKASGDEQQIRKAYISLLKEALPLEKYIALPLDNLSENINYLFPQILYHYLFANADISKAQLFSTKMQQALSATFSDVSNTDLVIGIAITVCRKRMEDKAKVVADTNDIMTASRQYQVVSLLKDEMQDAFDIRLSDEDTRFLLLYLQGADSHYSDDIPADSRLAVDRELLVSNLIAGVSRDAGIDFRDATHLFEYLYKAVIPAMHRVHHDLKMYNPHLSIIEQNHPIIFRAVQQNIAPLEMFMSTKMSVHEVGFIAMHFITAAEALGHPHRLPNVVVVCGLGFGDTNMLVTKLQKLLDLRIVAVITLRDLPQTLRDYQVDLIITAVQLVEAEVPSVLVSPFLSEQDVQRILSQLTKLRLVGSEQSKAPAAQNNEIGLMSLLTEDMIDLEFNASDFRHAIYRAGEILLNQDVISEEYIHAMIETANQQGPYMVFNKGIALPHANTAECVNRLGISMVRLQSAVESGHPTNDPVDLLFAFASPDNKSHVHAMMELGQVIMSGAAEKIRSAETTCQVRQILYEILT